MAGGSVAFGSSKRGNMVLIGEAGNGIVRLRLQSCADEPPFGMDTKDRQGVSAAAQGWARCLGQMLDEGGDEDRLSGARKTCDAKANMRTGRQVNKALRCGSGFEQKVGN